MKKNVFLIISIALTAISADLFADIDLSAKKVFVSPSATVPEIEAAKLLMRAQLVVSGKGDSTNVVPEVASEWPKGAILVGWMEDELVAPRNPGLTPWRKTKNLGDQIFQGEIDGVYLLSGNAPECAYFSVADVLYANGARFIHTGTPEDGFESGTFLEWMKGLKAPEKKFYQPKIARRTGFSLERWGNQKLDEKAMTAINNFAVRNCTSPGRFSPMQGGRARQSIGCESIQPPVAEFGRHPDWFPLVNGKRWRPAPGGWITEGCWSNKEFEDWVVDWVVNQYEKNGGEKMVTDLCLTNSDGGPKCECDDCKAYRAKFKDEASWYWDYHRKISKRVCEKVPGLYRYTFAYINSLCYPADGNRVLDHLDAIQYCPYQRCYIHPYSDKECKTNEIELRRSEEWKKSCMPIGDFDYCYDVFNPSMNMPSWDITWDVIRYWTELNGETGTPGVYMEAATLPAGCGGKSRASAYAVARAMWDDAAAPADLHLRDFIRCAYGDPRSEPFLEGSPESVMYAWYTKCAKSWMSQKAHLTATFNNPTGTAKTYFSEELEKEGAAAFALAESAIRSRMGTPLNGLAEKQLATLEFERKYALEEWAALRKKALSSSLEINCELGDDSDAEFDRVVGYAFTPQWKSDPDMAATGKVYRTSSALRVRVSTVNPSLKPVRPANLSGDVDRAYMDNHIEIFLQAPGDDNYYHLCVGEDGSRYDARCKDNSLTTDSWKSEVLTADGFHQYTVTIPWTLFGEGHKPADNAVYKMLIVIGGLFPDPKKEGEMRLISSGLPRVGYHDIGAAADILIDANAGRRAGGK